VVNAVTGGTLARVEVTIADTRSRRNRISTVTGDDGQFEFAHLPAGKYSLMGSKRGYITSSYEQHEQYSTAIVTGAEFDTDRLVLRLMPMAMIAGHVMEESGEPVRGATIQLFRDDHGMGMNRVVPAGGAATDDRGYFDIGVLQPGTYFVAVSATPWYAVHPTGAASATLVSPALDVAYPTTFYGGATDSDGASPIELKGGERHEIDVRLVAEPALHLTFRVPAQTQGEPRSVQIPIFQKRMFDASMFVRVGVRNVDSAGEVEITGVAPGKYDVMIRGATPSEARRLGEIDLEHNGQELNSGEGTELGKVKLTLKLPEEEPLPRQYGVGLRDAGQKVAAFQQGIANAVIFEGLKPGTYGIVFVSPGGMYSVARTISGTVETAGAEVNVTAGSEQEITAELIAGVLRIDGVAEKNGKPVAGVMVALVPKGSWGARRLVSERPD
jgi:hypothetical protein